MDPISFVTLDGQQVPAVTAEEMREIDRVAVEEVGLSLLMMMEHAGRAVAETVMERRSQGTVLVLAGGGGNGGGGLCAARHLANHGYDVEVVLDREPAELSGAPARQWRVLGDAATDRSGEPEVTLAEAAVVVDALVGYSLKGAPREPLASLIEQVQTAPGEVISLDVPSGVDATTGERPGAAIEPSLTLTLALPKTGLELVGGDLQVADLGIPGRVYEAAGIEYVSPFAGDSFRVQLERAPS